MSEHKTSPLMSRMERVMDIALCLIRKWWRPITCVGIAMTMFVHGIIVPMYRLIQGNDTITDLSGLSLLITSIAGTFAVREWGKTKGNI